MTVIIGFLQTFFIFLSRFAMLQLSLYQFSMRRPKNHKIFNTQLVFDPTSLTWFHLNWQNTQIVWSLTLCKNRWKLCQLELRNVELLEWCFDFEINLNAHLHFCSHLHNRPKKTHIFVMFHQSKSVRVKTYLIPLSVYKGRIQLNYLSLICINWSAFNKQNSQIA